MSTNHPSAAQAATHICPHCGQAGEPHLRGAGSARSARRIALVLWLSVPLAAAIPAPASLPLLPGFLAFGALGLALVHSIWTLLALAAPRVCEHCGAERPVPLASPRGRELAARRGA